MGTGPAATRADGAVRETLGRCNSARPHGTDAGFDSQQPADWLVGMGGGVSWPPGTAADPSERLGEGAVVWIDDAPSRQPSSGRGLAGADRLPVARPRTQHRSHHAVRVSSQAYHSAAEPVRASRAGGEGTGHAATRA